MEIGSFIELQFKKGLEYYKDSKNIIRLNTGRAAIYHAVRVLGVDTVWIPVYQCDTVREFLLRKGINIKYYHIDSKFNILDIDKLDNEAILIVNYYGIMSNSRMEDLAKKYTNVIIDNSQAFFSKPIKNTMNVYSCRKFVGVPDGSYVIGNNAEKYEDEYELCYSSDTSVFLLERIEYGCEGKAYQSRMINEKRIDSEDIKKMSKLTRAILDGTDYDFIIAKRKENFEYASKLFNKFNKINPLLYYDNKTVPMVYPLVVEDDSLIKELQKNKHFQGHWWSYILEEDNANEFESYLSRYIIPITIDQRYGIDELNFLESVILEVTKNGK